MQVSRKGRNQHAQSYRRGTRHQTQSFGGPSNGKNGLVTLKSITINGVNSNGARIILYGDGKAIKTLSLAKMPTQTLTLDEPGVGFIQVRANNAFTVDDVVFEVAARR